MGQVSFQRTALPIGDGEEISLLVAREKDEPKAVFMSYESFLELAATFYTAVETLKAAGVDPDLLADEPPRPKLRVVATG